MNFVLGLDLGQVSRSFLGLLRDIEVVALPREPVVELTRDRTVGR